MSPRGGEGGIGHAMDNQDSRPNGDAENLTPCGQHRYDGPPVAFARWADGTTTPAPFLLSVAELTAFLRRGESVRFPSKTIARYRSMGLRAVRVGRRVWFRLDDVLRFLDAQQARVPSDRAG
jgi:hypothetical protein